MAATYKRPRDNVDEASLADCPFSIRQSDLEKYKLKKRPRRDDKSAGDNPKVPIQKSPFEPTGKFKTHETMDIQYAVDPLQTWSEMTRYNTFMWNGSKYLNNSYVFVANESTIESQKSAACQAELSMPPDDAWIARILEIRGSDEHHVYARVYWMYRPEELPPHTLGGQKCGPGRQPYHGQDELIASNHMDIINVTSITQQVTVDQITDESDDQIQHDYYWRQALDMRTNELSAVEYVCKCRRPANPDKVLIRCPKEDCNKWLHEECLKHEVLMRVWKSLGRDKPYKAPGINSERLEKELKDPPSPIDPGSVTVASELSIPTTTNSEADSVQSSDTVDIKGEHEIVAKSLIAQLQNSWDPITRTSTEESSCEGSGPHRKNGVIRNCKPYEGLLEATFKPDEGVFEIKDLRAGVEGGKKSWLEEANCLVCNSRIY